MRVMPVLWVCTVPFTRVTTAQRHRRQSGTSSPTRQALQQVFAAPWDCTITPLDTCGLVTLTGANYRRIYRSEDPWLKALVENYRIWLPLAPFIKPGTDPSRMSTTLFDTVAVHAAYTQEFMVMEDLPLRVTDDGYTVVDSRNGRIVHCATKWKDIQAFKDTLVDTLIG